MRLAFRADAGVQQGTGHVVRSLTLAREFQKSGNSVRMISSIEGVPWLSKMIEESGVEIETCAPHTLVTPHASNSEFDLLVVDSYRVPVMQIEQASKQIPIMAIVDYEPRGARYKLLLDQNLDAKKYPLGYELHQMIGPSFALVREEIRAIRRTSSKRRNAKSKPVVLVMIGGSDPVQLSILISRLLSSIDSEYEIHFVTSTNNHLEISSNLPKNKGNIHSLVPDIHSLLNQVDVVISAAGTSSLDLSCIGVPTIYIAIVENQIQNLMAISKLGIGFALGEYQDVINKQEMLTHLVSVCAYDETVREEIFTNSQNLVDGLGASRVVREVEKLFGNKRS